MESERFLTSFSLIPRINVVLTTKRAMESCPAFIRKAQTRISQDRAACVQPPEAWILPENMLWNPTEVLVYEQLLPHIPFYHDGVHAIVLQKQWMLQIDPNLELQSRDGRLSDTFSIALAKVVKAQQHQCLPQNAKKCFVQETAAASPTSLSILNVMDVKHSFWKTFQRDFPAKPLRMWYASNIVSSDHNPDEGHSRNIMKEDVVFFRVKEEVVWPYSIFQL